MASQWNIFDLEDELLEFSLFFYNSLKKIPKSEQDGIRELRVLSACSMNSQSLPRFSRINSLKKENQERFDMTT